MIKYQIADHILKFHIYNRQPISIDDLEKVDALIEFHKRVGFNDYKIITKGITYLEQIKEERIHE